MARHRLTRPDPRGRTNRRGFVRRVQLPAGSTAKARLAAVAHRENPRKLVNARLAVEADPIRRIELALDYLKSAATKYQLREDALERVERAVMRAGDRHFAGRRLPAAQIANNRTNNRNRV